ncbi:thiosulfate oxidation carrier protein SoxY [Xanthobacter oligotrophicus]|uniref:thiosulfate oxidation carrier protein SoxY n=1 Tax=Xanthobacter oligotrophicus TaxID=2607286 RepID=UPI0011F10ECD|nr:thiosulfate oxidation carrier protein SoxY [Xanthobacter oligotrophicus]MCG5236395.1 thiosulfate oxidation carrier protein SoxY [Xanthobacter oligotrophicus]
MDSPLLATRRRALQLAGVAALAAVLAPRMSFATEAQVAEEMKKLFGGKAMGEGKIKLDVPEIAENGLVVPINIDVDSPMTEADFVKSVHVFADGNPLPQVVTYTFTPESGKASASARMRLAQTQNVIAVAEMSSGALFSARSQVKVTIGGCGG